ncbi:MAG: DUF3618 domain-containing protein [Nocardioidaceae bacterium]
MTTSPEDQTEPQSSSKSDGDAEKAPSVDELQVNIERNRDQLGETVDALTAKLDVKTRTKERIAITRQQAVVRVSDARSRAAALTTRAKDAATDENGRPTKPVLGGGAGLGVGVVGVIVLAVIVRRRR